MGSETPGGQNHGRRKLSYRQNRSADKYYASADVSAVGSTTAADSTLKPGERPQPNPQTTVRAGDRSADKYYRGRGVKGATPQQAQKDAEEALRKHLKTGKKPAAPIAPVKLIGELRLNTADAVNAVVDEAIRRVQNGAIAVPVRVKVGASAVIKKARTLLDLKVSQEAITEEEYHRIVLGYATPTSVIAIQSARAPTPPTPTVTKKAVDNPDDLDAFLAGESDDPVIDTAARTSTEINMDEEDEADEDNDFLALNQKPLPAPEVELAPPIPIAGTPAVPVSAIVPGKRQGRGA